MSGGTGAFAVMSPDLVDTRLRPPTPHVLGPSVQPGSPGEKKITRGNLEQEEEGGGEGLGMTGL